MLSILSKALIASFQIITVLSTIFSLFGFTIRDLLPSLSFWSCLGVFAIAYLVLTGMCFFVIRCIYCRPFSTRIRGNKITIKAGNLFEQKGWKVIPFNEYFDTQVDDIVIAHSTLNGLFIDNYCDVDSYLCMKTTLKRLVRFENLTKD